MRVWLIESEQCDGGPLSAEPALRSLAQEENGEFTLVGVCSFRPDTLPLLRAGLLHVIAINTHDLDVRQCPAELLSLNLPLLLLGDAKRLECWTGLASQHTVGFASSCRDPQSLLAAFWTLRLAHVREQALRLEVTRGQQRLQDRIVIEKAKGVLMQRTGIPEYEAYQRLRVQSRRQRRQIRDIAQSILDTELLLSGEAPGKVQPVDREPLNGHESEYEGVTVPEEEGAKLGKAVR